MKNASKERTEFEYDNKVKPDYYPIVTGNLAKTVNNQTLLALQEHENNITIQRKTG